jgi:PAS domain S-box-containing protein
MNFIPAKSIVRRLQIVVGTAAGLVLAMTVGTTYLKTHSELEAQTNAMALSHIREAARRVDDYVGRVSLYPRITAGRQQAYGLEPDPGMVPFMAQLLSLATKEEVYGLAMAFEAKDWREEDSMPWVDRTSWPNPNRVDYDYHDPKWEWYNVPKTSGALHVTEPYFDEGGSDITMITISVPMFDASSEFFGVATADLALDQIREHIRIARLQTAERQGRSGLTEYIFLVSRSGKVVVHPNEEFMVRKGFSGTDVTVLPGGERVAKELEGFAQVTMEGKPRRIYWATSPLTGWKTVLSISENAILEPVHELTLRSLMIGGIGLVVIVLIVSLLAHRLTRPLADLNRAASAIESGEFQEEMVRNLVRRNDELGELGRSFRKMALEIRVREENLSELNQNLERTVEERTSQLTAHASDLEKMTRESEERASLEAGLSALNSELRGNLTVAQAAEKGLAAVIDFLGASAGALYALESDDRLHRLVAHAYPQGDIPPRTFAVGDGLVGEAAKSRKSIFIEPGAEGLRVVFGFGEAPPSYILEVPLVASGECVGVIELCLFQSMTGSQGLWLEKASETIANALRFARESEERREAEERTRLILESSSEGIFGVDTDGKIVFVNAATCRLLGFPPEEMIGQPSHALIHHHRPNGDEYPVEECPMYAAYKRGEANRVDDEFLWRKDGSGLPVEYGATPIRKDGEIVGAVITFSDITERKRAEQELRQANFLSDMALELAHCGYWHIDYSDPDYYYQSERAANIVGEEIKPDGRYHLQDEWFSRLIEADPGLAEQTSEKYQGAIEGKYPNYDAIYAYKRPSDGKIVWLHAAGSVVRGSNGEARYMYGVYQDITEEKEAEFEIKESELRLRETEQFYRSVLELAPDGMMVVDAEGVIQLVNAQTEKLFGYTRDELVGQSVEKLVPEDIREKHPGLRAEFHQSPNTREMGTGKELRGLRKDGSLFPVEIGLSPLPVREGAAEQVAVSVRDITERKEQEDALRLAKAKAEEATEMKSMFLANMSHEIRTPMNAIIGLSHLALKTPLNPKQNDYVCKIHNAGTSLLSIINDILDFSKIEAGKLHVENTDFQIDEVIASVTTLTAQKAHEKGIEFLVDVASDIPEQLKGDPLRLGQVLTNLINNSIKFTERGEIRLRIETIKRTGEKVQLRFSVQDTGIGMTKEQSARLFQPFSQADMSTTRKHGGTGLGLTICKRLVELMGGQIWLESEPGEGSTFTFSLWLGVGESIESRKLIPQTFANLRILVVDDNPAAREILVETLQPLAARTDAVSSGPEAIAAIKERDEDSPYDVIFMDWKMPGMDGLQAIRLVKNDSTLKNPPAFIVVTAFGREEVREEAEVLNVDGFLVKPVTKSMLVDSLVNVFAPEYMESMSQSTAVSEERTGLTGLRVLLAEDNEINQQIAVELLQDAGATVEVAKNGREAVEKLFSGSEIPPPYDLVLMDLQMPEMDGYQATRKIRSDPRFTRFPIIAMTAHATLEERQRCLDAGMDDHVAKPIDPSLLFDTLEKYYVPVASEGLASEAPASKPIDPGAERTEEIPLLAGLDIQDGLSRVAGNRGLYLKLLRQFAEQQDSVADRIEEALRAGDREVAERLAHTVKGVAGNLGAHEVQRVAGAFEKAISSHSPAGETNPIREEFETVLKDFLDRLREALPQRVDRASQPTGEFTIDPERARQVLIEMLSHLNQFDPAAADCLETNREYFQVLLGEEAFAGFEQEVNNYSFAEAISRLELPAKEKGLLPS